MSMVEETTTIEVKTDLWAALDKRKNSDESFDQYIRRLVNNTNVPMGNLENVEDAPAAKTGVVERADDPPEDVSCTNFDSIEGFCENEIAVRQEWKFPGEEEWSHWHWCEEHAPDEAAISD